MAMESEKIDQATLVLKQNPSILAAYLHGSVAKGTARSDSDVDIAIIARPGENITLKNRLSYAGELEIIFQRPVDIGLLSTQNLVYAKEVILSGKRLFTTNQLESDRFMATCLSMYAELQVQRKEVLDAYRAA